MSRAGPNLGMDEFATVGEAIGEFASENALVVIGTALDESVGDELRVTVVATGLGQGGELGLEKDMRLVVPNASADVDYKTLDKPTVMRKQASEAPLASTREDDPDYLDIPAFLRRQAD